LRRSQRGASEPEPGPGEWTLEVYERLDGSMPYVAFAQSLDACQRLVLDIAVRTFLARQGHNVCGTEWGKALGQGLYEFRIRRTLRVIAAKAGAEIPAGINPDQKILLRVFFAVEGARIVLLLSGYDKGANPSEKRQDREIKLARTLLREHRERQRRAR